MKNKCLWSLVGFLFLAGVSAHASSYWCVSSPEVSNQVLVVEKKSGPSLTQGVSDLSLVVDFGGRSIAPNEKEVLPYYNYRCEVQISLASQLSNGALARQQFVCGEGRGNIDLEKFFDVNMGVREANLEFIRVLDPSNNRAFLSLDYDSKSYRALAPKGGFVFGGKAVQTILLNTCLTE